ncbi:hypothetical protein JF544_08835 [Halobacillus kuroshimensis]|uniref:Uncharacterized protein n=1 Tax=Halobacillus kuroshimensis TaxID=302481 RepID=A0ABS3DVH5_9BACI|nr:hypothetical protein [Halobacillus kuroshimensis]
MENNLFHIPTVSRHQRLFFPFLFSTKAAITQPMRSLESANLLSVQSLSSIFQRRHEERSVVTPAGTARAEDPLGPMVFLTKSVEAVPAASIHR